VIATANSVIAPRRTARTATASSVKAPTGAWRTATANSVKAPTRSTVRASLRSSPLPSFASLTRGASAVLASSGTGRTRRPFHSRPDRLVGQSERVGMKGAGRSSPPRRSKHRSERSERGAQRVAAVRATGGFHAVWGCGHDHSCRGFHAVWGCGHDHSCRGFHAVWGCGSSSCCESLSRCSYRRSDRQSLTTLSLQPETR